MAIGIDFECFSEIDIQKQGSYRYADDDSTEILILSYAIDNDPVQLWTPDQLELPQNVIDHIINGKEVYSFGYFDYRIWNWIGAREFNFPTLSREQFNDIQALAQSYSLHGNLAQAGEDLRVSVLKSRRGKELIKKFCVLDDKGRRMFPWDNPEEFEEFKTYCFFDTASMREIRKTLPRQQLIPQEKKVYELTYRMNSVGLPVDVDSAKRIWKVIEQFRDEQLPKLSEITDGVITNVTQHKRIKDFCISRGVNIPNTQIGTVSSWLQKPDLDPKVRQVLDIKELLGGTAVQKFNKLLELVYRDTLYDNLRFHGAGPGRWTGQGFQMQNLPRETVKAYFKDHGIKTTTVAQDTECAIQWFTENEYIHNPIHLAKGLVRAMIKAPKGYYIIVSDYSAIECVILLWLANDKVGIQKIIDGEDLYVDMASYLYEKGKSRITEAERQFGKVIILGCGYCMGWKTFKATAANWGIKISDDQADVAVKAYRELYDTVVNFWYALQAAAIRAVTTGQRQTVNRITFGTTTINGHRWLAMLLPSGKAIYYNSPRIAHRSIPGYEHLGKRPTIVHMGIDPYTKKWSELSLGPNRLVENATQGTAREVMAQGLINIDEKMPEVHLIGTVHDEGLGMIKISDVTDSTMKTFDNHLCDISWAKDCPITAKGYIADRYRKG